MMSATKRVLRVAVAVAAVLGAFVVAACNDEKKPPLTPDGPEMTTPVGDNADAAATPAPTPAPTTTAPPPAH